jgi:hypothetical protein
MPVSQTSMTFQQYLRLAVATGISVSALSLHAQSMRRADMETNTTITSITNLKTLHRPALPFGAVDETIDSGVSLDATISPDASITQISDQNLLGRGSAGSHSRTSLLTQALTSGTLPSAKARDVTGSLDSVKAPSVHTTSSLSAYASATAALLTRSTSKALETLFSQGPQAPSPDKMAKNGTGASLHPFSRVSGSQSFGHRTVRSLGSDTASFSEVTTGSGLYGITGGESSDQEAPRSFFESIEAPFGASPKPAFEGFQATLGLERTCGDACSAEGGDISGDLTSNGGESDISTAVSDRNSVSQPATELNASPRSGASGLSDEAMSSESESQKRMRNTHRRERDTLSGQGKRNSTGSGESWK